MWELFQEGGPLMWPLLLCSIISVTFILERFWFWSKIHVDREVTNADRILASVAQAGSFDRPGGEAGVVCRMLEAGLQCRGNGLDKAMEVVAMREISRMRRGMDTLDTIITVAPMLGIMGTVTGIIFSFEMLGLTGIDDPRMVVAGISEALITTATGLGISILTVFPYNYFNARINHMQDLMEIYASHLELNISDANGQRGV